MPSTRFPTIGSVAEGVTAVGGGGDYRVAEFVRVLILALFERLNSEKLDRTLEVEQFNKLMDIIEPLQINFRDGIKAGEFQYSPEQKKLYTPSVGVTSENSSIIQTSIEIFIDNLLQDLKK